MNDVDVELDTTACGGRVGFRAAICYHHVCFWRQSKRSMDIAKLALEDGTVFTGKAFGARGESDGEVVFNTSMTGYQEVLTDPSYHGQIVTMTYHADRQLRDQRRGFRELAAVGARVCRPRASARE